MGHSRSFCCARRARHLTIKPSNHQTIKQPDLSAVP
jgi:hypothetical protein